MIFKIKFSECQNILKVCFKKTFPIETYQKKSDNIDKIKTILI